MVKQSCGENHLSSILIAERLRFDWQYLADSYFIRDFVFRIVGKFRSKTKKKNVELSITKHINQPW